MKKVILFFAILTATYAMQAQEKSDSLWNFGGVASLNFSQLSLTNWAAGGEASVAANGLLNLSAHYASADANVSWTNDLILGYGMVQIGKDNPFVKSDDKIDFASKFGYKAANKWFYSGLLSFKSQFDIGWDVPSDEVNRVKISNFLAPGYLNLSLGMDYKPSDNFSMLVAPLTGKMTFVMDDDLAAAGAFGVPAGQNVRSEFGGYVKIAFAKDLMKNVKLNTKIDLFSNYLDNPQYVDVNFDLLLSFKVNDYISASFVSQLIYDYDIRFPVLDTNGDPTGETEGKIQFKELFGIGLTYSF